VVPWLLGSISSKPAAWNILQLRHCATQRRQSAGAFPLDESFEIFPKQCGFVRQPGELLGNAYEIIVEYNSGSHGSSVLRLWHQMMLVFENALLFQFSAC
jgi:hypothetical protein